MTEAQLLLFRNCKHTPQVCKPCLYQWAIEQLSQRFGDISCPCKDCDNTVSHESLFFLKLPKEVLEMSITRKMKQEHRKLGLVTCANDKCMYYQPKSTGEEDVRMICDRCHVHTCKIHGIETWYRTGSLLCCELMSEGLSSDEVVQKLSKNCPKCFSPIEKKWRV